MSFNAQNLLARRTRRFTYKTADSFATMAGAGYFPASQVNPGDIIDIEQYANEQQARGSVAAVPVMTMTVQLDEAGNMSMFGLPNAVGDGVQDDSDAFYDAIIAAAGKPVHVPPGTYFLGTPKVFNVDHDIILVGDGVTLLYPDVEGSRWFDFVNTSWSDEIAVTSLDINAVDWPQLTSPEVTRVNGATNAFDAVKKGDILLLIQKTGICANGSAVGTGDGTYPSEQFKVLDVAGDGSWIILSGMVTDLFDDRETIVCRHTTAKNKFHVTGFTISADNPDQVFDTATYTTRCRFFFGFQGFQNGVLKDCHFENIWEGTATLRGCWSPQVDITFENLVDDSPTAFGYGISINGSTTHAKVRINGSRCRHGCTVGTTTSTPYTTDDYFRYGFPRHTRFYDSTITESQAAGFDVHEGFFTTFDSCHVLNGRGESGQWGMQMQSGCGMVLKGCSAYNTGAMFTHLDPLIWTMWDDPDTYTTKERVNDVQIIGCHWENEVTDFASAFVYHGAENAVGTTRIDVVGGSMRGYSACYDIDDQGDMKYSFQNFRMAALGAVPFRLTGNGELGIYGCVIDYETKGNASVIQIAASTCDFDIEIDGLTLTSEEGNEAVRLINNSGGSSDITLRHNGVKSAGTPLAISQGTAPTILSWTDPA